MKIMYQLILLFSFVHCSTVQPPLESDLFSGLITDLSIDVQGEAREYHLFLPDQPNGAAVVLLFHGHSGSSDQIIGSCLLYTSPSPRDQRGSRMPSSA